MTHTILATDTQVAARINELASELINDFSDKNPLFVALLRGAAPFASQLMFAIAEQAPMFHPELDYMMVKTYGAERHASEPRIITDLAPDTVTVDRPVIIIDDVLDKGITAHFVASHLKKRGAADIRLAVLADKQTERVEDVTADYTGFVVDDVWLVGMGMDDADGGKEHYRWAQGIWSVGP
jgi:hypoxanthine phosphoribosyltransferase